MQNTKQDSTARPAIDDGAAADATGRTDGTVPRRRGFALSAQASDKLRLLVPFISLICLIVLFSIWADGFFTLSNAATIARQSSPLLVIAGGATLVVVAGSVDLSVGAVAALVGTLAALLVTHGHPNMVWLLVLLGAVCGLLNGFIVAYLRLASFLVTLGTLFVFGGIASKATGGSAVSAVQQQLSTAVNGTALFSIPNSIYWGIAAIIILALTAHRTVFGRHVYAIGGNERVAGVSGLPVRRVKVLIFVLSSTLAAVGGLMLMGGQGGSSPNMGDAYLLQSVAAIVMGGTPLTGGAGGPLRTVLGVLTIVTLSDGLTLANVDPYYVNIVFGAVVILAVLFTTRRNEVDIVK